MGGPLTNQQRSTEYYRLAYQCAERQMYKPGCDHKCAVCTLNVHLYVDDPRDATLIKTSAMIDCRNQDAILRSADRRGLVQIIFFLLLVGLPTFFIGSCIHKHKAVPKPVSFEKPTQSFYSSRGLRYDIPYKIFRDKKDSDGDGKWDCVDKAIQYYELWGPSARIMWHNYNGFNHLYIRIKDEWGVWINVEPGNYYFDFNRNTMEAEHGSRFNPSAVRDITAYYKELKANTFRWVW